MTVRLNATCLGFGGEHILSSGRTHLEGCLCVRPTWVSFKAQLLLRDQDSRKQAKPDATLCGGYRDRIILTDGERMCLCVVCRSKEL